MHHMECERLTTRSGGSLHCEPSRISLLAFLRVHPLLHQVLEAPLFIPLVVLVHGLLGTGILDGLEAQLVNIAQMTFA